MPGNEIEHAEVVDAELVDEPGRAVATWEPTGRLARYADRPDPDSKLSEAAKQLVLKGVNPRTATTYRAEWWKYVRWCGDHRRQHLPATPETIIEWMHELGTRPGRYSTPKKFRPTAPTSVRLSLSTIAVAHRNAKRPEKDSSGRQLVGYVSPTNTEDVRRAFRGYVSDWLKAGHRPDTSYPLRPEELAAMIATLDVRSTRGLMCAALLAVTYDAGFRRSEACAVNHEDIDWQIADRDAVTEDDFIIIHVPMSKTDQSGEGDEVVLYAHPDESAGTCPVRLLHRWVALAAENGHSSGAVFRRLRSGGPPPKDGRPKKATITAQRLPDDALEEIVAATSKKAGLHDVPGRRRHIVPHSLRAGSATAASERGADVPELAEHFRWKSTSPTPMKYVRRGRKKSHNPARRVWRKPGGEQ